MAFIVSVKGQKQIIISFSFFLCYLVNLVGIVNGRVINLSFFWSLLTCRMLYLFTKLCKRLESNINSKEIKYLSIILSSKLRKLYKLNFQRILNVIKLDMPWLNILLLSISGWINSIKMNSSVIFISDKSLGNFLFCVLESSAYFPCKTAKISLTESIDITEISWKLTGIPQIC